MLQRRALMASAAVLPLTSVIPAAWAATPKDTVVIASQIDDLITLDPGEAYEISAQINLSNVYDRLVRYEAEDMTKLVGGVAESWTVSPDAKTYTFKLRPNQKFESGATVTADDMAFSLQRVVILDKTPAFLFTQLGWNKDNVKSLITAPDPSTLKFTITENFAPSLVLNLMATVAASVVEKKVAMANEANGDLGNTWLKTHSATSGPYRLVSWKANESVSLEAHPAYHLGAPHMKRVIVRHVPEPGTQRLLLEKGDIDIALSLLPDQLKPLAEDKDIKIEFVPVFRHLVRGDESVRRTAEEPEGPAGDETSCRLPGHGEHVPQGALPGAAGRSCPSASSVPFPTTRTSSTSPRRRPCWPRPAIPMASSSGSTCRAPRRRSILPSRCSRPWGRPASR